MAYVCEIGTGQRAYLDNQGKQTIVTTASSSLGQQQQSSQSFVTGSWTASPESFRNASARPKNTQNQTSRRTPQYSVGSGVVGRKSQRWEAVCSIRRSLRQWILRLRL